MNSYRILNCLLLLVALQRGNAYHVRRWSRSVPGVRTPGSRLNRCVTPGGGCHTASARAARKTLRSCYDRP